jgi:hypothetical protein
MKTALRIVVVVILIAACISSESLSADFGGPAGDGWHIWRVASADGGELQIWRIDDPGFLCIAPIARLKTIRRTRS